MRRITYTDIVRRCVTIDRWHVGKINWLDTVLTTSRAERPGKSNKRPPRENYKSRNEKVEKKCESSSSLINHMQLYTRITDWMSQSDRIRSRKLFYYFI